MVKMVMQIFKSDSIRHNGHRKKRFGTVDTVGTVDGSVPRMPRVSCKFFRKKLKNIRVNCINPERTKTPMRVSNFGNEPEDTLLKSEEVATASLNTLVSAFTGEVIDVKRKWMI